MPVPNAIYLFIFSCVGSLLQPAGVSLVVARGLCSCGTWAPERVVGSVVVARGILVLRPGIEPASPALEGGFLTTGPLGKSLNHISKGDFPGGPVVNALCFHCSGHGFDPWSGTKIPHAAQRGQKNKKKKITFLMI